MLGALSEFVPEGAALRKALYFFRDSRAHSCIFNENQNAAEKAGRKIR